MSPLEGGLCEREKVCKNWGCCAIWPSVVCPWPWDVMGSMERHVGWFFSFILWFESQLVRQQFLTNQLEMLCVNIVHCFFSTHFFLISFYCLYSYFWSLIVIFISFHSTFLLFFFPLLPFPTFIPLFFCITEPKFRYTCLGKRTFYFKGFSRYTGNYTCIVENLSFVISCNI